MRISNNNGDPQTKKTSETRAEKKSEKKTDKAAEKSAEKTNSDVSVDLSSKAKNSDDKEMRDAEILMKHVDSGKLSESERDMALKRVGEILDKHA